MATINKQIIRRKMVPVTISRAEVQDAFFVMSRNRVLLDIHFFDTEDRTAAREVWLVKGDRLNQVLGSATGGGSLLSELRSSLDDIVLQVETTSGLKDQLMDNGEIRVYDGVTLKLSENV